MSITIQPELEALLRARAEDEGITVEQYVERIARQEPTGDRYRRRSEVLIIDVADRCSRRQGRRGT